jgi:hypothetical protein
MSQAEFAALDVRDVVEGEPLRLLPGVRSLCTILVTLGFIALMYGYVALPPKEFWGTYYVNTVFWMGLAAGSVMITAILQVVRAIWSAPLRRLAEANVAFLPWIYVFFLCSYFGSEYLFPWGSAPMPGREWWMQPDFVYSRMAVLLGFLFFLMWRFVRMALRCDYGYIREQPKHAKRWDSWVYDGYAPNWKGSSVEIPEIQNRMSWNAPALIALYALIYSLFAFEMIMSMDTIWYSNMYGGFTFVGNIYLGWVVLNLLSCFSTRKSPHLDRLIGKQQRWDLGKLTLGFCMLWGYMFFAQYLPQWYGNLPEETQWMILRTKEYPWKPLAWVTFAMCFIIPFILYASEDVKKVRGTLAGVGLISFFGLWLEKYMIIMPSLSPEAIPFGIVDIGLFIGFLGLYGLCVLGFLDRHPYIAVASPMTRAENKW